jgi:hypothetical protein
VHLYKVVIHYLLEIAPDLLFSCRVDFHCDNYPRIIIT